MFNNGTWPDKVLLVVGIIIGPLKVLVRAKVARKEKVRGKTKEKAKARAKEKAKVRVSPNLPHQVQHQQPSRGQENHHPENSIEDHVNPGQITRLVALEINATTGIQDHANSMRQISAN